MNKTNGYKCDLKHIQERGMQPMAKIAFTAGRIAGFKCPPDKAQAFLWDANTQGLGLRVTAKGLPAFVFQSVYQGVSVRIVIGKPSASKTNAKP